MEKVQDNPATILVVDDTETNIDILVDLLDEKYDIVVATSGERALKITEKKNIDLILLDILMPEMDGFETCIKLKENKKTKNIPIIFITAKTDEASIEKGYDIGGIDYITKPFKYKELQAKIKLQLELKFLIQHLEHLSSYDQMTNIYNRRKFFELSEKKFTTHNEELYAVMLDIDKFKSINDSYGHPVGDLVIKKVTKTIAKYLNEDNIFGRLGGEEFSFLVTGNHIKQIQQLTETIRVAVEENEVEIDSKEIIKCTISFGIAQKKSTIDNLDQLLKEADDALYEAKNTGRNKCIFRTI